MSFNGFQTLSFDDSAKNNAFMEPPFWCSVMLKVTILSFSEPTTFATESSFVHIIILESVEMLLDGRHMSYKLCRISWICFIFSAKPGLLLKFFTSSMVFLCISRSLLNLIHTDPPACFSWGGNWAKFAKNCLIPDIVPFALLSNFLKKVLSFKQPE